MDYHHFPIKSTSFNAHISHKPLSLYTLTLPWKYKTGFAKGELEFQLVDNSTATDHLYVSTEVKCEIEVV